MTETTATYEWAERRFYVDGACPPGMCWSVREMFSYRNGLDHFIPHLQAMADGLERASFETYDYDERWSGTNDDDNFGMFVVGLRPMTDDDETAAQAAARRQEILEREQLAHLKAKYPDV